MRYAHTNIIARDWQVLERFYSQIFDCYRVPPPRNQSGPWLARGTGVEQAALEGVHLRLPGHGEHGPTLEIYSYKQMLEKPEPAANRQGLGHLAFEVEDVRSLLERVLQAGGHSLGEVVEKEVEGVGIITFVYATDPEGNILELQSWS